MKFLDLVLTGEEFPDAIDRYIEQWHSLSGATQLHEFLGFTWDEYALWVEQPEALNSILFARKSGATIKELEWDECHQLAARSQAQHDSGQLKAWLKKRDLL